MSEPVEISPEAEINLTLPVGIIQSMLNVMGKEPFAQVAGAINLIQSQTAPQMQALQAQAAEGLTSVAPDN